MSQELREKALWMTFQDHIVRSTTSEIVADAAHYAAFMAASPVAVPADAPAPAPSTATTASAPASSAGAASPKASKGKKASSSSTAAVTPPANSVQSSQVVPATSGDMFGEETSEAPKASATAAAAVVAAGSAKSEKAAVLTADNVRAALVDLQTKAGGRDAVNALLAKHTKNGTSTLSGLNDEQERFKAVIEGAKALVAAAAK